MNPLIHPSAVIDPGAQLGKDVQIGPYAVIEDNVVLGDGCRIGPQAQICWGSRLGAEVQVYHAASVGCLPQDLKYHGEETSLEVGARTVIREYVTLARATEEALVTRVGAGCLLMAYVHVAHDCQIGDGCIFSNGVQLAGHVKVGDNVIMGGTSVAHQFVRIGSHAFIGGATAVGKDVPPYIMANDNPLRYCGLNSVGLARRGFDAERQRRIKRMYRLFFGKNSQNVSLALAELAGLVEMDEDARLIHAFITASERGIIRG